MSHSVTKLAVSWLLRSFKKSESLKKVELILPEELVDLVKRTT